MQDFTALLPRADLLVNTNALGMAGQPGFAPDISSLSASATSPSAIVCDVVYGPIETRLLATARAGGLETVDGLEMLIGQAARAFPPVLRASRPARP